MATASERKALVTCAFIAGCVLLAPGEFRAAVIPFALSGVLWLWHRRRLAAEQPPPPVKPAAAKRRVARAGADRSGTAPG